MTAHESGADEAPLAGLAQDVGWTYVNVAVTALISLVITGYVLRHLGAGKYGFFALLLQYGGLAGAVDFGLGLTVARAAARIETGVGSSSDSDVIASAHSLYAGFAVGATLLVVVALAVMPWVLDVAPRERAAAMLTGALIAGSTGLATLASAPVWLLTGQRRFRALAVAAVLGSVTNLAVILLWVDRWGIVALGVGQVVAVVANRAVVIALAWRSTPWFGWMPSRPRMGDLRRLGAFALPLLLMAASSQIVTVNDLTVVGAIGAAAAVGFYRAGSLIPTQLIGIFYRGYDAVFPSLAGHRRPMDEVDTTSLLSQVASYTAGVLFGVLAAARSSVVRLLVGHHSSTAEAVLLIFCGVWLLHVPARGLWMTVVAAGRQTRLTPALVLELLANVLLTVLFGLWLGTVGVALATLVAVGVAYGVVMPGLFRRETDGGSFRMVVRFGAVPALVGAGASYALTRLVAWVVAGPVLVLAVSAVVGVICLVAGLAALPSRSRRTLSTAFRARSTSAGVPLIAEAPLGDSS